MTKPIVVAEVGINHNGDIKLAKNLIAMAKNFGADYIKFQKKTPELCVPKNQWDIHKDTIFGPMRYIDYKNKMEFTKEHYDEIDKYCKRIGIKWFASPWDIESVEFLKQYNLPFIKVASPCLTDIKLLEAIEQTKIPVILSTGMSTKEEILTALSVLGKNVKYLLHCTSSYPTPVKEMNMNALNTFKREFSTYYDKIKIGFSNHSQNIIYTIQAAVMGAEMLEFHITLDRGTAGTDHLASIGPTGFDRIMKHLEHVEQGWGDGNIGIKPNELEVKRKLRKKC